MLETTYKCPSQPHLSPALKNMLLEFNQIYQLINSKGPEEEQESKMSLSEAHSRSASFLEREPKNQSTTVEG